MVKTLDQRLFNEAKRFIPGGVNSPVRSFKSVGGYPVFINHAKGSKIYSEDGKGFIDYCLSWGALILGHAYPELIEGLNQTIKRGTSFGTATKLEIELAKLIVEAVPSVEQVRLTNSGTEAVMGAIRLARAYTKRNKIIKFAGSYHGHTDYLLAESGSGLATLGIPDSRGVPKDFTKHTIVIPYNNIKQLELAINKFHKDLAAIIIEPVMANCGVILPHLDFLQKVRRISNKYNIVLIFDEVITGFRLSYGGAQEFFDIKSDLTCLGKIIGGGLPIGAFGGRKEIMKLLAPEGDVYQAGTLSGNPIAVSAGIIILKTLKEKQPYDNLAQKTIILSKEIKSKAKKYSLKLKINSIGSMFSVFFVGNEVIDAETAKKQNRYLFNKFFHGLLEKYIYFSPSCFETNFLSIAHTERDLEKTLSSIDKVLKNLGGNQ